MDNVVDIAKTRLRRIADEHGIMMHDIGDDFVGREAVSYGTHNERVAVFFTWQGETVGLGMTADQARELGLALIGAAAIATKEFRALVEQREEK